MTADIVVGSVAVDIVPDTSRFREDLAAKVKGITVEIPVVADLDRFREQIDEASRDREATIRANADTAAAGAQLDEAARDRTSRISVVDGGGLASAASGLSGLASAAIVLGPTLVPILATVGAIGLALAAPLAIAAGGATVFGFLAGFAVKNTNKQLKDIEKTDAKLAGLTKGTKEYRATQQLLKSQMDALSPAQKKYADSLDHIKATFAGLVGGKTGQQLLGPVAGFLDLVAAILPKLSPVIAAVSGALTTLLGDLADSVKGPGFKNFIATFSQQIGPDIVQFGHIAGGALKGFTGFVIALGDAFGPGVLNGLQNLTDRFADVGQQAGNSKKLQSFVDYFHRVGPQVGDTIGAVARAVGRVVEALAPLGPPILKIVEGIANSISDIPIPVLTALAAAFIAMVAASKVGKGLNALGLLNGSALSGKSGLLGGIVASTKPIPVFVTNPGFGGAGGGGTGVLPGGAKAAASAGTKAEEVAAAAKAAAAASKVAGGGPAAQSIAAARAAKEAAATFEKNLKPVLTIGKIEGLGGLLKTVFAAPAFLALNGESGQHAVPGGTSPNFGTQFVIPPNGKLPTSIPSQKSLVATGTAFDALKAHAQQASRQIDQIGPHADNTFTRAGKNVAGFVSKLDAIHDKKVTVLLNDLAAVQSLEALQAFRIKDKTFSVSFELEMERAVGPGGGIGHPVGPSAPPRHRTQPSSRTLPPTTPNASPRSMVNIEHAEVADTKDIMRKSNDALVARAGGGVMVRPSRTASFG